MSVESRRRKLWRESSRTWSLILGIILCTVLFSGLAVRFYAVEPVRIQDNSMQPEILPGTRIWICKLPSCTEDLKRGDIVLVSTPGGGKALRTVFGLPGDSVHLSPEGSIRTGDSSFHWDDESEIVAPRTFYIPQKGDSISFDDLNDISFDYAVEFLRKEHGFNRYFAEAALLRGSDTLPLSRVGTAHLFGRPVGLREVHGLHWQEYFLISLQINREEPGARAVHFERKLYRVADSAEVSGFRSPENAYYLICRKGNRCEDSRFFGYIPQSRIQGKALDFSEIRARWTGR